MKITNKKYDYIILRVYLALLFMMFADYLFFAKSVFPSGNVFSTKAIKAIELLINSDGENFYQSGDDGNAYIETNIYVTGDLILDESSGILHFSGANQATISTATENLLLDPGGSNVLIDGGLTIGSTTDAGDNNLRVEGTSLLSGNVEIGAVIIHSMNGNVYKATFSGSVNDDATISLPTFTNCCRGSIIAGTNEEYAEFLVDNDGDVTLIVNSDNVVANESTDGNICIGNAASQEPLLIENKLGGVKNIFYVIHYD